MRVLFILFCIGAGIKTIQAQNPLFIPDTVNGPNINLTVHADSVSFLPGLKTPTIGINQYSYLGPTLLLNKSDSVLINVHNQLNDTTTIHWHGLHVSAMNDGGPHSAIPPGHTWNPSFTVRNNAGTYWYHSHMHGKTGAQAMKGLAGLLIVRDPEEANLILPRNYGQDDFPIVVQTHQFDSINRILPRGMEDSTTMVNATQNPYLNVPAQVVRLRLLNADQERTYNFGLSGNQAFYLIATDQGLIESPLNTNRIRLSPGERAEILLNLNGLSGQELYLMSYASELPMDIQGGPTMPMPPGNPPMDSPINGVDFNILKLIVTAPTNNPVTTFPASLVSLNFLTELQAQENRTINFTAANQNVMDGPFYFNGQLYNMMRVDYEIPLDNIEIWTLNNQTMVAHPFHIHDVNFKILDRDGNPPLPAEQGFKDVVLVQSMEEVRIIMQFSTFADSLMPYVYHCHVLMHEDDGMMGQFVVKPTLTSSGTTTTVNSNLKIITTSETLTIISQNNYNKGDWEIRNINGEQLVKTSLSEGKSAMNISNLSAGLYFSILQTPTGPVTFKFIKS